MDDEMAEKLELDAVVTVVEAGHVERHIDDSDEVKEQIAFADVILLNKTDLVDEVKLEEIESRIKAMNSAASIQRTRDAEVEMDRVLGVGGFDLAGRWRSTRSSCSPSIRSSGRASTISPPATTSSCCRREPIRRWT